MCCIIGQENICNRRKAAAQDFYKNAKRKEGGALVQPQSNTVSENSFPFAGKYGILKLFLGRRFAVSPGAVCANPGVIDMK